LGVQRCPHQAMLFLPTLASLLTSSFVLPRAPVHIDIRAASHAIACTVAIDVDSLEAAGERVRKAASKFGPTQGRAASEWVEKAIGLDPDAPRSTDSLLSTQLALFEECLLDDDGDKCADLDEALTDLESNLGKAKGSFLQRNRFERAGSRLKAAAGKFGPEQTKAAAMWIRQTRSGEATKADASLLEQQVALFGECLVEDGEGGSKKCKDLQEALSALLEALDAEDKQFDWIKE